MVTERIQRRIDRLLDQAEAAADKRNWPEVRDLALETLSLDEGNEDAAALLQAADKMLEDSDSPRPPVAPSPTRPVALSPALPASFVSGRYVVNSFLGEGGRKRVYLAHDTRLDRDVAIAVIKTEGLDFGGLARVQREAQAMARLGDHPHVVTVYDVGDDGGQPFIVSQYMAGGSIEDLIAAAPDRRLPLEQVLRLAGQVCQGLEQAHRRDIVHRDLKPGNVWLTEDGDASVGDFGLAVSLDRSRLTAEGMMLGTVSYMAPEQALGQTPDPRSDLYSLGCILYEMATGRPPFVGEDSVALVTQHLNTPPVAPSWHRPDLPKPLESLILRLLEKDPAGRPASATEVAKALTSIDLSPASASLGPQSSAVTLSADPVYRQTFVGREQELKQLHSALDNALSGEGALLMVVGEPGIGKTSVCDQLATYVAMRGGRTLRGNCYEEGSLSLPYLPFVEAMRSYVLSRDPEALKSELGTNAGYVARIVSEVRDRVEVDVSASGDAEDDRWRLLQAVTGFLRNAANVQPLMLLLEDLHWSDRGTLDLLTHLARNLQGARLLVVGTYRDVEVDRSHPLSGALADLRRAGSFSTVRLRGLNPEDVQKMMANIANREVPWQLAEQVHRQTEGHPLFVQEVMRYLVEEGILTRDESGRLRGKGDTPLAMQIPEGLRDVIGKRISRLSAECNRVLAVAAVIGRDFSFDILRTVASLPEESVLAAIEEAMRVGVLQEQTASGAVHYRFAHAFFRQTLYEEMIAPRRLRLHQDVARALESQYARRLDEHAAELAEHFSYSTDPADLTKAVDYARRAAQRAVSVFDYGEAARLLEKALGVQEVLDPDDRGRRCDLLSALGEALMPGGEPLRAAEEIAEEAFALAEGLQDSERASRACQIGLAGLFRYAGAIVYQGSAYQRWAKRADRVAVATSVHRVYADIALSAVVQQTERLDEAWAVAQRALELARSLDDNPALFHAAYMLIGPPWPPLRQVSRLKLAEEFIDRPAAGVSSQILGQLLGRIGQVFLNWGHRARAEECSRRATDLAERTRDAQLLLNTRTLPLRLALLDGRVEETAASARALPSLGEQFGSGALGELLKSTLVRTFVLLGEVDEVSSLERARALAGLGAESTVIWPQAVRVVALVHSGRRAEARELLARTMSEWRIGPDDDERLMLIPVAGLLEASIILEDRDAAGILARRLELAAPLSTADNGDICPARLLGGAAALLGESEKARGYYQQALEVCAKIGFRPEIALTRFQLAELLLEHYPGERTEALEHLDFALAEFREMKMAPSVEKAMRLKMELQGIASADVSTTIDRVATAVQTEHPDLRRQAAPDGTVTLLFSDIEGSTPLNEQLGDSRWMEVLRAHNALIRKHLKAHGGFEVKSMGDGFMLAFASARKALACAIAIQAELGASEPMQRPETAAATGVRVRIGLHTGEVVREGDDFFGKDVNLASRIGALAGGGQILVSSLLRDLVAASGAFTFDEGREVVLKGLAGTHRVYEVVVGT